MRKLPVFVLAAATALTVAGVPMTAQAATCPLSSNNFSTSSCFGQSGDINSILSKLGCKNGTTCITGTNCTKGSNCSGSNCSSSKNGSSCSKTKAAATNNTRQCNSISKCWK
ncbi:hypothetical protein [Clostridium sp. Marseille-P2415]|uniref:hypothetical protein n=1 Tax=Clostridium sp. Marseille-P2415 TaxID=1805471 RepID=UPI000988766C|nr:hypothetical protein [Clostridium sp. Marseille-P2415]